MHGTMRGKTDEDRYGQTVRLSSLTRCDYALEDDQSEDPVKAKGFSFSFPKLTIPLETIIRITLYCYLIAACMKYLRG